MAMSQWQTVLEEIKRQTGWTVDRIAQETGVSQSYLSRVYRGKQTNPSSDVVERLARGLGVSVAALDGEMPLKIGECAPSCVSPSRPLNTELSAIRSELADLIRRLEKLQERVERIAASATWLGINGDRNTHTGSPPRKRASHGLGPDRQPNHALHRSH